MGRKTAALGGHAVQLVQANINCIDVEENCHAGTAGLALPTCLEADDGVAKCDHLAVAGDAESQLRDDGELDSC